MAPHLPPAPPPAGVPRGAEHPGSAGAPRRGRPRRAEGGGEGGSGAALPGKRARATSAPCVRVRRRRSAGLPRPRALWHRPPARAGQLAGGDGQSAASVRGGGESL